MGVWNVNSDDIFEKGFAYIKLKMYFLNPLKLVGWKKTASVISFYFQFYQNHLSLNHDSGIKIHLFRKTPPGGKVSDVFSFSGQASDSKPAPPRVNRLVSAIQKQGS